jgi:site-specific DNA-methyltransferase (adenine-specific)
MKIEEEKYTLYQGDCLEEMQKIANGAVDMVLADPPYGTTACSWDAVIPFEPMWVELKRVTKKNAAIVMTASQPFTSVLICSNLANFAHCWVWDKRFAGNFVQAKRQPMKDHEDVVVFGTAGKQPQYFPQMIDREEPIKSGGNKPNQTIPIRQTATAKAFGETTKTYTQKYPTTAGSLIFSNRENRGFHPTQKPVALMEYLIKTYTNEGQTVLDFTMGSGTTGVACMNLGRKFIGIEREEKYFNIAKERIEAASKNNKIEAFFE